MSSHNNHHLKFSPTRSRQFRGIPGFYSDDIVDRFINQHKAQVERPVGDRYSTDLGNSTRRFYRRKKTVRL